MGSIKVAIVGMDFRFAGALSAFLSAQPVFEVVGPDQADVVLTDSAFTKASQLQPAFLIIGPDDPSAMIEAVDAGAMGYVVEGSPLEEVAHAAHAVGEGEAVIPPLMLGALLKHVVHRRRGERQDLDRLETLTDRERDVFGLLAAGLDRNLIAERLYISAGTVRSHLQRIFKKLDVHTHAEAVAFAARCGLRTDDHGAVG